MATPTADKLRIYFPSKHLAADGNALPSFTADGGALNSIQDTALSQADGYWDGALGWFAGDSLTPELQGQFFHVRSFTGGVLTLSRDLPAAPQAGDTFRLALGGNWRSSYETFGLLVGGVLPELNPVAGINVSGVTIRKASALLGEGTLTLQYTHSQQLLRIKMDSQPLGIGLDVSTSVTGGVIFAADGQSWIMVDVNAASLPTSDRTDTWTLQYPERTLTPDYEGYETKNDIGGKTRYRLEAVKNTDPEDAMVDLAVYVGKPVGSPSSIASGSLGLTDGSFDVADANTWPTKGFWIKNTAVNAGAGDCRYVNYRSGNTLYCLGVTWATLGFDAGSVAILPGDTITDATSGATAIVDQVEVTSGDWGTSDAAGTLLLKLVDGTFGDNHNLQIGGATRAVSNGNAILGLRGYQAVNWATGQAIELMADVDIGFNKPANNQYENPAEESLAPADIAFSDATSAATALQLGNLGPGKLHGVWRREWIMDGHQSRSGLISDTRYSWS